ncbi:MAG: ACT domain-containing protein, partial [Treponema sp.]|nr:ACT domain-containing protein [Treponema sp.]
MEVRTNCAIVSVVGDGMIENRGIAAKFLDAVSSQDINILAIAHGSSERCISCVIDDDFSDLAVRVS